MGKGMMSAVVVNKSLIILQRMTDVSDLQQSRDINVEKTGLKQPP